jgi:hypothetical protein
MRTRTLLLLAVGCGLVILLAGGIQLLRVSGQHQSVAVLRVGQAGRAGDVNVTLVATRSEAGRLIAVVGVGGVDDASGFDGFSLVAPGKVLPVESSTCTSITVAAAQCELAFITAGVQGTSRQLIFRRADQQLRWVLAQGD